jgi:hypothetical protein
MKTFKQYLIEAEEDSVEFVKNLENAFRDKTFRIPMNGWFPVAFGENIHKLDKPMKVQGYDKVYNSYIVGLNLKCDLIVKVTNARFLVDQYVNSYPVDWKDDGRFLFACVQLVELQPRESQFHIQFPADTAVGSPKFKFLKSLAISKVINKIMRIYKIKYTDQGHVIDSRRIKRFLNINNKPQSPYEVAFEKAIVPRIQTFLKDRFNAVEMKLFGYEDYEDV